MNGSSAHIDVVLPVLDEVDALKWVLPRMPKGFRALVVDNGSTDGSREVARRLGAAVVSEPRRGFGAACFKGLSEATSEVVAFMDADASLDPVELPSVTAPLWAHGADLVLGRRRAERGSWPLSARLANRALCWELRRRGVSRLRDIGPMRAGRRTELLGLGLVDRRFGWPLEMVLKASAAGWRIQEVDVTYAERIGRSKVTGTARGTVRAVRDMARLLG